MRPGLLGGWRGDLALLDAQSDEQGRGESGEDDQAQILERGLVELEAPQIPHLVLKGFRRFVPADALSDLDAICVGQVAGGELETDVQTGLEALQVARGVGGRRLAVVELDAVTIPVEAFSLVHDIVVRRAVGQAREQARVDVHVALERDAVEMRLIPAQLAAALVTDHVGSPGVGIRRDLDGFRPVDVIARMRQGRLGRNQGGRADDGPEGQGWKDVLAEHLNLDSVRVTKRSPVQLMLTSPLRELINNLSYPLVYLCELDLKEQWTIFNIKILLCQFIPSVNMY